MSDGRVAIVTGAGSGVGRCVAQQLVGEGYRVVLVGRRAEALAETGGGLGPEGVAWVAVAADVAADADRARIVAEGKEAFGRIDAVVNCAGKGGLKKFADHDLDAIDECFAVNAIGPIELSMRCVREMNKDDGGAVVFVSSMSTKDPFPGLGVYGCAKSALNAAARAITNDMPRSNIRAYSVAPGAIETAMLRGMWDEKVLPADKTLSPDEVARAIVDCVTGETAAQPGETIFMPSH